MDDVSLLLSPAQLDSSYNARRPHVSAMLDESSQQELDSHARVKEDMARYFAGLDPGRSKVSVGDVQKVSSLDSTPARLRPQQDEGKGSTHVRATSTVLSQPGSQSGSPIASKTVSDLAIMSPNGQGDTLDISFSPQAIETAQSPASPSLSEALDDVLSPNTQATRYTTNENLSPILPRQRSSYFRPGLHGGTPHSVSAMNSPVQAVSPGHISAHEYFQRSLLSNLSVVYGQRPATSYLPSMNRSPSPPRAASVEVLAAARDVLDSEDDLDTNQTHISSVHGSHRSLLIGTTAEKGLVHDLEQTPSNLLEGVLDYTQAESTSDGRMSDKLADLDDLPLLDEAENGLFEDVDEFESSPVAIPDQSRPTTGVTTTTGSTVESNNIDVPNISYEQSFFIPQFHADETIETAAEDPEENSPQPIIVRRETVSEIFSSPLVQHDHRRQQPLLSSSQAVPRPRSEPVPHNLPAHITDLRRAVLSSPQPQTSQKAWETPAATKQFVAAFPTRTAVARRVENFEIPQERLAALQPEIDAMQQKAVQPPEKMSLRESSMQLDTLQKENWGLKLKIMFLEKHHDHDQDKAALVTDNVRLQEMAYNIGQQVKSRDRMIRSLEQQIADAEFEKVVTNDVDYEELYDKIAHLETNLENVKLDAEDREEYLHDLLEKTKTKLQNVEDELYRVQTDYRAVTASAHSEFSSVEGSQTQVHDLRLVSQPKLYTYQQDLLSSKEETKAVRARLAKLSEFLHDSEMELAQANELRENAIRRIQAAHEQEMRALTAQVEALSHQEATQALPAFESRAIPQKDSEKLDATQDFAEQLRIKQSELEDLGQSLAQLETRYATEKSSHQAQLADLQAQSREQEKSILDLRGQITSLQSRYNDSQAYAAVLQEQIDKLEHGNSKRTEQLTDREAMIDNLRLEKQALENKLQATLKQTDDGLDHSTQDVDRLSTILSEFLPMPVTDPFVQLQSLLMTNDDDLAEMREQMKCAQADSEKIANAYKQQEGELADIKSQLELASKKDRQADLLKSTLKRDLTQEIERRNQVEGALRDTTAKLSNVSDALAAMKDQYSNIMTSILPSLNSLLDHERQLSTIPAVYDASTYNRLLHTILEGLQNQADRARQESKQVQASSRKRTRDLEAQMAVRDEKNERLDRQLKEALKSLDSLCKQNERLQATKKHVNGHRISASNVVELPSRQVSVVKPDEGVKVTDTWILYERIKQLNEALAYERELRQTDDLAAKARLDEIKTENKRLMADTKKLEGDRPSSRVMRLERGDSKTSSRAGSRLSMNENKKKH